MSEFHYSGSDRRVDDVSTTVTEMVRGYLEAAVFTECGEGEVSAGDQFSLPAVALAFTLCSVFMARCGWHAWQAHQKGRTYSEIGADLWFTQNGHGVGFWDRGLGDIGERLSEAARSLGEAYLHKLPDGSLAVEFNWGKL